MVKLVAGTPLPRCLPLLHYPDIDSLRIGPMFVSGIVTVFPLTVTLPVQVPPLRDAIRKSANVSWRLAVFFRDGHIAPNR